MTTRSPIVALLWENWRLTRIEAVLRTGLGIVGASAALLLSDAGTRQAFVILLVLHGMFWLSITKLNGGRFLDGYKPGFPLYLLYTRPVPTVVFVGVAMAYDALSGVALYLGSAALVGYAFGQTLPLFSVAVWIVTFHLVCICLQWSTRSRIVQWSGMIVVGGPLFILLVRNREAWPLHAGFSPGENALLALLGLVAFGLTVAGVAHQRRGGTASAPRAAAASGYPNWLVALFRFSCPTSSATRAQVWFEMKSSGLPILAISLAVAFFIALLFAVSIPAAPFRPFAVFSAMIFLPAVLLLFGGNAFGIRQRQGRRYASAFEMTQPYGTAQMAGLKLFVRAACVLVALIVVGGSLWASSSLVSAWGPWTVDGKDLGVELLQLRHALGDNFFRNLDGYAVAVQPVLTSVAIAMLIASHATFTAIRARYPRRLLIAGLVLLFYGLAVALLSVLSLGEMEGIASAIPVGALFRMTGWLAVAALVFATIYILWSGFAERALTARYLCGAVAISAAFGVASLPANSLASVLATWILPLTVLLLAPWALGRIRHI